MEAEGRRKTEERKAMYDFLDGFLAGTVLTLVGLALADLLLKRKD